MKTDESTNTTSTEDTNTAPVQDSNAGFNVKIENRASSREWSPSPAAEIQNSKGVLNTCVSPTGGTLIGKITDDCRVRIGGGAGIEVTVAQAAAKGYLVKNPDGTYADVSADELPEAKKSDTEKAEPDLADALQVEAEVSETLADWSASVKAIGGNPVAVLGEVIASKGEKLPDAIQALCRETGVDVGAAQTEMRRMGVAVDAALNEYVTDAGVGDVDAFWKWVWTTNERAVVASAVTQAVFLGDARPFKQWAKAYLIASNFEGRDQGGGHSPRTAAAPGTKGIRTSHAAAHRLTIR